MQQPLDHAFRPKMVGGHNRRHDEDTVCRILTALASASYTEVGLAYGMTRGAIAGLVSHARRRGVEVVTLGTLRRDRPTPPFEPKTRRTVRTTPKGRPAPRRADAPPHRPSVPVPPAPVAAFGTGLTILSARRFECRAMDDVGHCCGAATAPGSSWCPAHRALYVRSARVAA